MHIAIDSSRGIITGVVSGRHFIDIIPFYDEMAKILKANHVNPPFHWSKISRKVKDNTIKKIIQLINESKLKFNVFSHERPPGVSKKEYFHSLLPRRIVEHLEPWLKNKGGNLTIDIDRDYDLNRYNKTENLLNNFMIQIGFRLVGKHVKIMKNKFVMVELKQDSGEHLKIFGRVCRLNESNGIQIVDMVLGIIKEDEKEIDPKRLHFRKI